MENSNEFKIVLSISARRSDSCPFVKLIDESSNFFLTDALHIGLNKLLQHLSFHHRLYSKFSETCSMVSDPILRIVVCSYFLTAVKSRHLRFPFRTLFIHRFLVFNLENFLFQNLCSPLFVGVLTAFFLNENSYSCGNMNGSAS